MQQFAAGSVGLADHHNLHFHNHVGVRRHRHRVLTDRLQWAVWHAHLGFGNFEVNKWIHVAVTWDGLKIRTYLDGALKTETIFAGSGVAKSNFPLSIGASIWGVHRYEGSIDDLRIYAKQLNTLSIRELAQPSFSPRVLSSSISNSSLSLDTG